MEERNIRGKSELFSKSVRAGKRTYFFDVKSTRDNNLYITVTESKKRFKNEGGFFYEKHKVFLYKEDFIKFSDGLNEVIEYIRKNNPTPVEEQSYHASHEAHEEEEAEAAVPAGEAQHEDAGFSDVDFDDLGK